LKAIDGHFNVTFNNKKEESVMLHQSPLLTLPVDLSSAAIQEITIGRVTRRLYQQIAWLSQEISFNHKNI
jgi:hypothetical protein